MVVDVWQIHRVFVPPAYQPILRFATEYQCALVLIFAQEPAYVHHVFLCLHFQ